MCWHRIFLHDRGRYPVQTQQHVEVHESSTVYTGTWGVYYIYLSNYFYKSIFGFISFVPQKVFTKKYDASEPERMIRPSSVFARFAPPALTEDHAEALRRDGICVVDEAIPAEQVRDLRDALERETGGFRQTMQAKEIRSDKVRCVRE